MVYVLLGTGFEETEAIAPIDLMRRAGVEVLTVGINGKTVFGGHGIGVEADILLGEMDLTNMDTGIHLHGHHGFQRPCLGAYRRFQLSDGSAQRTGSVCTDLYGSRDHQGSEKINLTKKRNPDLNPDFFFLYRNCLCVV